RGLVKGGCGQSRPCRGELALPQHHAGALAGTERSVVDEHAVVTTVGHEKKTRGVKTAAGGGASRQTGKRCQQEDSDCRHHRTRPSCVISVTKLHGSLPQTTFLPPSAMLQGIEAAALCN